MKGQVALVTGASRGVGAETAMMLARWGADLVMCYRNQTPRAAKLTGAVQEVSPRSVTVRHDLTDPQAARTVLAAVGDRFGKLDVLILNASGGLEKGRPADYPLQLNRDAQVRLVDEALPLMPAGGRIVFVTSHQAHFYGSRPVLAQYEPVAASKHAGEQALRARIPELAERGIDLVVVSGDIIEGTVTAILLNRAQRGLLASRKASVGRLLSVEEFASAVAHAARDQPTGGTIYVGSTE
jgi:NAD(P)-dependent dehydrogenase (short-subunit alcohol dehydrogenase family)